MNKKLTKKYWCKTCKNPILDICLECKPPDQRKLPIKNKLLKKTIILPPTNHHDYYPYMKRNKIKGNYHS